jgi:hypothetical protein
MTVPTTPGPHHTFVSGRPPLYRTVGGWLWALLPLATFGTLAWVPALHGWARVRQRSNMYWTLALAVSAVLFFTLTSTDTSDGRPAIGIAALLMIGSMIAGSIHSFQLRPHIFGRRATDAPAASAWPSMSAIAQIEHARARRAEARALAERDPAMARELRIGRPDIPGRTYDDGGLVDLNHAVPDAIAHILELDPTHAQEICRARAEIHGFTSLDELGAYTDIPAPIIDGMRERTILLRY